MGPKVLSSVVALLVARQACNGSPIGFPIATASADEANVVQASTTERQGWTSSINQRGTANILWTCFFTLFLCSWSAFCLNLPAPGESFLRKLFRKLVLTLLCAVGPEFILQMALAQLLAARRSVPKFRLLGHDQWTVMHGFYANMGGFVLHPTVEGQKWKPFPIDAEQLHYLLVHGYVTHSQVKNIDKQRIRDKNKVDLLLRVLTMAQAIWFLVNTFARWRQKLAITTLELTTCATILCSIFTYSCWWNKPADVEVPEILETTVDLDEILRRAGDWAKGPYSRTPLDFISRDEWSWSILWSAGKGYLRSCGLGGVISQETPPMQRFADTQIPKIPAIPYAAALAITAAYFAVFFFAWNASFPSDTEKILWRTSCILCAIALPSWFLVQHLVFDIYPVLQKHYDWFARRAPAAKQHTPSPSANAISRMFRSFTAYFRNNSRNKDPALYAPLKAVILVQIIGVLYSFGRCYVWVEDLIELRSLPANAYQTVNWGGVLPFLGAL